MEIVGLSTDEIKPLEVNLRPEVKYSDESK